MLKVENIDVFNFEGAIRGMRNPLNSWAKSDSHWIEDWTAGKDKPGYKYYYIGDNDLELMQKLFNAGESHRKYLRQIFVTMDITAPEYFFSQFDTYKVGTTANSTSKMHTLHKRDLTIDDFSSDKMSAEGIDQLQRYIDEVINRCRRTYVKTNNKTYWNDLIRLLPMSFNQRRTVTLNYEVAVNIINQRTGHKLDEWTTLIETLKELPYLKEIMGE